MVVASVALVLLQASVQASPSPTDDGFRCSTGRLVSVGDSIADVRERCGEPDSSDQRTETRLRVARRSAGGSVDATRPAAGTSVIDETVTVDEWSYDLGNGRLTRHLRFENGRLAQVTTGSRSERKERRP